MKYTSRIAAVARQPVNSCVPVSASACTLLELEKEHQMLLRALGQAQQRSSDAIQHMQQELHATRKAMQWWRTLAMQHIPADILEAAMQGSHTASASVQTVWQNSLDAAQDCQNQCLSRQQLWRVPTQQGNVWCLRDAAECVLDEDSLAVTVPPVACHSDD